MILKTTTLTSFLLGIIWVLTTAFQTDNKLTKEQAIQIAENFVAKNGYTSLSADKSKLSYELFDQHENIDSIIKQRYNTLQSKAFCISEDDNSWHIGFLSTSVNVKILDSDQLQTDLTGRAIILSKDGKEIKIAHKDPLFSYYIILGMTAEDYFKQGCYKDSVKDYQGAINDFNKSIKLNPKSAEAYLKRGNSKFYLQDYRGALTDYNNAIEITPKYVRALNNRGSVKCKLQDYNGAIADYNKAIELKPNDEFCYLNRGLTKEELQDNLGAIADYTKAIEINPKYIDAYYSRGLLKQFLKDNEGACFDWNKAKELGDTEAVILIQNNCK